MKEQPREYPGEPGKGEKKRITMSLSGGLVNRLQMYADSHRQTFDYAVENLLRRALDQPSEVGDIFRFQSGNYLRP